MNPFLFVLIAVVMGSALYQKGASASTDLAIIKNLFDKVDSTPVSSDEARIAFKIGMKNLCEVNGKDPTAGFGTTEECLGKLESRTDPMCSKRVFGSTRKEYHSRGELKSEFMNYLDCAFTDFEIPDYYASTRLQHEARQSRLPASPYRGCPTIPTGSKKNCSALSRTKPSCSRTRLASPCIRASGSAGPVAENACGYLPPASITPASTFPAGWRHCSGATA